MDLLIWGKAIYSIHSVMKCFGCFSDTAKYRCEHCQVATYCSDACQYKDWHEGPHAFHCDILHRASQCQPVVSTISTKVMFVGVDKRKREEPSAGENKRQKTEGGNGGDTMDIDDKELDQFGKSLLTFPDELKSLILEKLPSTQLITLMEDIPLLEYTIVRLFTEYREIPKNKLRSLGSSVALKHYLQRFPNLHKLTLTHDLIPDLNILNNEDETLVAPLHRNFFIHLKQLKYLSLVNINTDLIYLDQLETLQLNYSIITNVSFNQLKHLIIMDKISFTDIIKTGLSNAPEIEELMIDGGNTVNMNDFNLPKLNYLRVQGSLMLTTVVPTLLELYMDIYDDNGLIIDYDMVPNLQRLTINIQEAESDNDDIFKFYKLEKLTYLSIAEHFDGYFQGDIVIENNTLTTLKLSMDLGRNVNITSLINLETLIFKEFDLVDITLNADLPNLKILQTEDLMFENGNLRDLLKHMPNLTNLKLHAEFEEDISDINIELQYLTTFETNMTINVNQIVYPKLLGILRVKQLTGYFDLKTFESLKLLEITSQDLILKF